MSVEVVDIGIKDDLQDIKIPEKFRINDNKVYMKKTGNVIHIIPYHDAWKIMVDSTNSFSDDFMEDRNQPTEQQQRETFD